MPRANEPRVKIPVNKLQVGHYIDLELNWREHPFTFSHFKIRSEKDIQVIRSLKLEKITVFPERSDVILIEDDLLEEESDEQEAVETEIDRMKQQTAAIDQQLREEKQKLRVLARKLYEKRQEIKRKYQKTASEIRQVTDDLKKRPANAIHQVDDIVNGMAETFDSSREMLTQLVQLGNDEHTDYNHITNVSMLSLMLGKAEGLNSRQMRLLGTGALLHDVGKITLPGSLKNRKTPMNHAETLLFQRHAVEGRKLVERIRSMSSVVLDIIQHHHEYIDGSGYPDKLKDKQLQPLTRIVAVTNLYDGLCNPLDGTQALTPKTALATLYNRFKQKVDVRLVEKLVSILGVYPPGTVVQLNDDNIGLVITTDPRSSLQPSVLIYDPEIPKDEAQVIRLTEYPDIKIVKTLAPGEYPAEIKHYLGIQERIGYLAESMLD